MKILAIRGVLDSSTGPRFEKSLQELLREYREPIGLDFSGLKYMTSAGVASFLRINQRAKERGGQLAIIRPSQEVAMMLDFLGISKHLAVFETEEEMRSAMPESRENLHVIERSTLADNPYAPGGSEAAGNPPYSMQHQASAQRPSSQGGTISPPPSQPSGPAQGSMPQRGGAAGGSGLPSTTTVSPPSGSSPGDAYYMGESIGRLSETLDGLTRNLKSLGKTMEDLQRTEHSLKEEFERERSRRRERKQRLENEQSRSFALSHAASGASGSGGGRLARASGISEPSGVEVPVSPEQSADSPTPSPEQIGHSTRPSSRQGARAPSHITGGSALEHAGGHASRAATGVFETAGKAAGYTGQPLQGSSGDAGHFAARRAPAEMNRIIECEQCGSKLRIYNAGRHLCPACKIEFEVETDGSTSYYEKLATS